MNSANIKKRLDSFEVWEKKDVPRRCGYEYQPLNPEVQGGRQLQAVGFSVHAELAQ